MSAKRKLQNKTESNIAGVDMFLEDTWKQIRDRNLYCGPPQSRQTAEALTLAKKAVTVAARTRVQWHSAQACRMMALTLNANGQYFASIRYYRRALAALDSLGHHEQAARTRLGFIAALGILGQYEQVTIESWAAEKWFEKSGDDPGRARLLTNIGNVHQRRENYEQAIECLRRSHELFESIGDETMLAVSKSNLAICFSQLGRLDSAEEMFSQAEKLSLKLGLADLNQQIRYNHNYLVFLRGQCEEALERFQELKREFREQKNARHAALCDLDIALIYLHSDMPAAALRNAKKAAEAFPKLHMRYEQAKALAYAGAALIQTHRFKKSLAALYSAQALFRLERNPCWMAVLDVLQAYVYHALRNAPMARALLNRARLRLDQIDADTKTIETIRSILIDGEDKPRFLLDLKTTDLLRLIN